MPLTSIRGGPEKPVCKPFGSRIRSAVHSTQHVVCPAVRPAQDDHGDRVVANQIAQTTCNTIRFTTTLSIPTPPFHFGVRYATRYRENIFYFHQR